MPVPERKKAVNLEKATASFYPGRKRGMRIRRDSVSISGEPNHITEPRGMPLMADEDRQENTDHELTGTLPDANTEAVPTARPPADRDPNRLRNIGPYRLLERIGEGGMGRSGWPSRPNR